MTVQYDQNGARLLQQLAEKAAAGEEMSDEQIDTLLNAVEPVPFSEAKVKRICNKVKASVARKRQLQGLEARSPGREITDGLNPDDEDENEEDVGDDGGPH